MPVSHALASAGAVGAGQAQMGREHFQMLKERRRTRPGELVPGCVHRCKMGVVGAWVLVLLPRPFCSGVGDGTCGGECAEGRGLRWRGYCNYSLAIRLVMVAWLVGGAWGVAKIYDHRFSSQLFSQVSRSAGEEGAREGRMGLRDGWGGGLQRCCDGAVYVPRFSGGHTFKWV